MNKTTTTGDTSANVDSTNVIEVTATTTQPTQQESSGETGAVENAGKASVSCSYNASEVSRLIIACQSKGRYNYSTTQKQFLQGLVSEYKAHGQKRRLAFDAIYAKHLVNQPSFATPPSMTAEDWKKVCILLPRFQCHAHCPLRVCRNGSIIMQTKTRNLRRSRRRISDLRPRMSNLKQPTLNLTRTLLKHRRTRVTLLVTFLQRLICRQLCPGQSFATSQSSSTS